MIGADAIIKCLEEEGVSTVFGYPDMSFFQQYSGFRY